MITSLSRIIKYGLKNFVRNGWLSVATTVIMTLTLLVFISLAVFDVISETAIKSVQEKIDISIYFKQEVSEEVINEFEEKVSTIPQVKSVEYISQEKAFELFSERHKDDQTISQALAELGSNPLLASLTIKAHDPSEYSIIDEQIKSLEEDFVGSTSIDDEDEGESLSNTAIIDKVTFAQNQLVIERLTKIINTLQNIGLGATLLLSVIAVLITFNTIRLAIYSNREELGIMRLVGATNAFINGPYLVTGILYGVIAALASLLIVFPIINLASPHVHSLIPELNLREHFQQNIGGFLMLQLFVGILMGAASSFIAIRKYLKL
jgi:cell division transport system permease protein